LSWSLLGSDQLLRARDLLNALCAALEAEQQAVRRLDASAIAGLAARKEDLGATLQALVYSRPATGSHQTDSDTITSAATREAAALRDQVRSLAVRTRTLAEANRLLLADAYSAVATTIGRSADDGIYDARARRQAYGSGGRPRTI
jgi:flagellar biosynthesis/type III secretory pathway chaperone